MYCPQDSQGQSLTVQSSLGLTELQRPCSISLGTVALVHVSLFFCPNWSFSLSPLHLSPHRYGLVPECETMSFVASACNGSVTLIRDVRVCPYI